MEAVKCQCHDILNRQFSDIVELKGGTDKKNFDDKKYREGFQECCEEYGAQAFRAKCNVTDNRECLLINVKFQNCIRGEIKEGTQK